MLTQEIVESIKSSVLCWLATVSGEGVPNVSPKEAFLYDEGRILIAHIASPKSVLNIQKNPKVCVSFIDVFTQRGHKVIGSAEILSPDDHAFDRLSSGLSEMVGPDHLVQSVIVVAPAEVEEIVAPSYSLHPETNTTDMIRQSFDTYRISDYKRRIEQGA